MSTDQNTVRLRSVSYRVVRRFDGRSSAAALLEQRLLRAGLEEPSVDAAPQSAV